MGETLTAILGIVYLVLGYWSTGKTIYANKIVFSDGFTFALQRFFLGTMFGVVLIPIAIIKTLLGR